MRGPIAIRLGSEQFTVDIQSPTKVQDILQRLIDEYREVREVWSDVTLIDREALILKNDADIGLTGGLETDVDDDDTIVILPLIHGG